MGKRHYTQLFMFAIVTILSVMFLAAPAGAQVSANSTSSSGNLNTTTTNPLTNVTTSSNSTTTSGSTSITPPVNASLPNTNTTLGVGGNVGGWTAFANGTIITSVNGVQMKFVVDPHHGQQYQKPSPPSGLAASTASSSQIDLSWNAPTNDGGTPITGYEIQRSLKGTPWETIVPDTNSATTAYSDTGLDASTTYNYRVFAINKAGTSGASNTATATTQSAPGGGSSGGSPGNVTISSEQSVSGTVSSSPYQIIIPNFNAGNNPNGMLLVGVSANNANVKSVTFGGMSLAQKTGSFQNNDAEFWYLANPSGTANIIVTMSGATSAVVGAYSLSDVDLTDPIPATSSSYNTSPGSPTISITTKYPDDLVVDLPSIYGGVTLGSPSCTQSWDANVPSAVTGASSSTTVSSPGTATCKWTASGSGDLWDDIAVEVKAAGASSGSQGATVPSPPQNLVATGGNGEISLSWTAPSSDGGSAVTGYNIYRGTVSGGEGATPVANTASTDYNDTGLANGQAYYYAVKAVNSAGISPSSNEAGATPQPPPTAPSAPTGLVATSPSSSEIDLSWSAPSDNGGAAVTGYKIERSPDGSSWSTISSDTGSTATAYSDTGLGPATTYYYRVSAINSAGTGVPSNTASTATQDPSTSSYSIDRVQSGLVAADSLTNETQSQQQLESSGGYWRYNGDAPAENAPYNFDRDTQGLHIGVAAPSNGTWAGYFAVSPSHSAFLWNANITDPSRTTPSYWYNNGMYIQTSNGDVSYVTCAADTNTQATVWVVAVTQGNITEALNYSALYVDNSANQPLTRDCTVITNGTNYLKVYLGGKMVYENSTLNLHIPPPFNAYLEPETSTPNMLVSTHTNYYVTRGEDMQVTNLPSNAASVDIVNKTGGILATAKASGGSATLDVGMYVFPLDANIDVYDSANSLIASGSESIYGGDVYKISSSVSGSTVTVPSSPSGLVATEGNGQVSLSWTAPSNNGGSAVTGYEIYRGASSGGEGTTAVAAVASTRYNDTGLVNGQTYYYIVKAENSAGTGAASNEASATPTAPPPPPSGITLDNVQSTSGTANQFTLSSFNAGSGTNQLLVVGISANNAGVSSVTFGGTGLTKAVSSFNNNDAEFWYLKNPSGTGNIVVTMAGSTSAVVGAYAFSGVDQTNPIPTTVTNSNTASSSPAVSITTKYANDLVLDLPSIYGGKTLGTPTCTQEWNVNIPSAITGASSSTEVSSPGSATCGWAASNGGDLWDDVAVEVKAAS